MIRPFPVEVPHATLDDLRDRLGRARYPEPATDPSQGLDFETLQALMQRWADAHDWRPCEARLNAAGSSMATLDGLDIHFLHVRSAEPAARPLVITHGWPGSILEHLDLLGPLSDPVAYGGRAEDAFHVVVPSLPGFGFSAKPSAPGWGTDRIADAWDELMVALGYPSYLAQGGDWGSMVSTALLKRHPERCRGAHLNFAPVVPPPEVMADPTPEEAAALKVMKRQRKVDSGYARIQSTKPQTLGYGLVDSPVGMAAWILEKFVAWTDGSGFGTVDPKWLLDNLTLWWVTGTGASAARLYWESYRHVDLGVVDGPVGFVAFPGELLRPSRRWVQSRFPKLLTYAAPEAGGHFPALEQPSRLIHEIRAFAAAVDA